ncbi:hypothetical protein ACFQH6_05520 [Halobacteriaceae archaeon GCM10025711]
MLNGDLGMTMDAAFRVLADRRRRYVLYHLRDEERVTTLDALTESVTRWERTDGDADVDAERIAVSLVHNHLPKLEENGAVEYDRRQGDVVTAERFDELVSILELVDEGDRDGATTDAEQPSR